MYSRDFHADSIPPGYGGNAFPTQPPCTEEPEDTAPRGCPEAPPPPPPQPPRKPLRRPPLFPLWDKLYTNGVGDLLSGDLLLIAVAALLLTGRGEGCEEEDRDLWLLLLLIYFMK